MLKHLELASQLHSRTKSLLPTGFELQILSALNTEKHMVTFPQVGRFTSHTPLIFQSMRLTKTRLQYAIYNLITQLDLGLQKSQQTCSLLLQIQQKLSATNKVFNLLVPKISPYLVPKISPYLVPKISPYLETVYSD